MGIFSKAGKLFNSANSAQLPYASTESAYALQPQIQSIWTPSTLQQIFFPGQDTLTPITVYEAMSLPAVNAAIGLISGIASRFPLSGPDWLNAKDQGALTPEVRIATTIQDLVFYNQAIWNVERDADGYVSAAVRVSPTRVFVDREGYVHLDGEIVDQSEIIFFYGPKPVGFLEAARFSVRHALSLQQTILNRATNPSPVVLIKETSADIQASESEIQAAMQAYKTARQSDGGGAVFVPFGLEISPFGSYDDGAMLINAREAVRTDLAGHLGIDAIWVAGSITDASIYKNEQMNLHNLLETSLKIWTETIASRLSQNDVVPEGVEVKFLYSELEDLGIPHISQDIPGSDIESAPSTGATA